jgi:CAAX protease family protein
LIRIRTRRTVLRFVDYNAGTPAWYGLTCFTIMVVAGIFTPLTRDTGPTKYIIDEFGIGLVITIGIGAVIAWRSFTSNTPQTFG